MILTGRVRSLTATISQVILLAMYSSERGKAYFKHPQSKGDSVLTVEGYVGRKGILAALEEDSPHFERRSRVADVMAYISEHWGKGQLL